MAASTTPAGTTPPPIPKPGPWQDEPLLPASEPKEEPEPKKEPVPPKKPDPWQD